MGYWVELIDCDTHRSIDNTSANITFNLSDMFAALPCKSPNEWIGHSVKEVLEKVDQSLKLLTASPKKYSKYAAHNGWGTVDGMRKFLTNVINIWEPYTNVGQVNGNLDEKNSVENPDDNGLTKLLLTEFNSKKVTGYDDKDYLEIITPAVDYIDDGIILFYDPVKAEISDDDYVENEMSMYRNDEEKRKTHEYMAKVAKRYGCVFEDNELKCKVRTTTIDLPIKTITLNAIIPMIQAETEIYAKLREQVRN